MNGHHYIVREPLVDASRDSPLLVLLHGYGSNENDLMGLSPHLDQRLRIVSVRAPLELEPGFYSWFPLHMEPEGVEILFSEAVEARDELGHTITSLQVEFSASGARTILFGFSQGASMALAVARARPEIVAGVAFLSGRCVPEMIPADEERRSALDGFPVLMTHGRFDTVISIDKGRAAVELLTQLPCAIEAHEFDIAHEIDQECLTVLTEWLQSCVNGL